MAAKPEDEQYEDEYETDDDEEEGDGEDEYEEADEEEAAEFIANEAAAGSPGTPTSPQTRSKSAYPSMRVLAVIKLLNWTQD